MKLKYVFWLAVFGLLVILHLTNYVSKHPVIVFLGALLIIVIPEFVSYFKPSVKRVASTDQVIILLPSGKLLISSFWDENSSDQIHRVPFKLDCSIETAIVNGTQTVKCIGFANANAKWKTLPHTFSFLVEGGYMLFGDQFFLNKIRNEKKVEQEILRICETNADFPYALFEDEEGIKAIGVLTGDGNDRYPLTIGSAKSGAFALSAEFLK